MRLLFRFCVYIVILLVVVFLLIDLYCSKIHPIAPAVRSAATAKYAKLHIHPLTYGEIPTIYREAVIATEDRRFANDPGIDPIGILRSLAVDIEKDGYVEGGSTITQQVVDNTLIGQQKTIQRKLLQAIYAIGLYDTMSKEEIFSLYANVVNFGNGAYGLYNASETYFGRPPSALNDGELTMLAGMPNAPADDNPFHSLTLARHRQRVVLDNMVDDHLITNADATQIWQQPLQLRAHANATASR